MKLFAWFILFLFFVHQSFSQQIDSTLAIYAEQFPQERMYIQFDKPVYAAGETIWFKAYLMTGNMPSGISKNCYADFYDSDGNLLAHSVFPIVQESAAGEFIIPDTLTGASVHIIAYTTWMLNFDTAFLYEKNIPVAHKMSEKATREIIIPSIHLFPEGGDVIEELPSQIAFAANDQYGRPVHIKGVVRNNTGVIIDTIKTEHDGMGSIRITYKRGETYTAQWYDERGAAHQTQLPAAHPIGVAMEIISSAGKKSFIIRRTNDVPGNLKQLHVVATMNQQMVYKANVNFAETNIIGGAIPTDVLATGILQITLFSNDWMPMAERVCYVNNNDAVIMPRVSFSNVGLGKRGKNTINISMPDSIVGNLSLAITDEGIGTDSSNNIVSCLLLTGYIKGAVYQPQYYFSNNSDSIARHLDLVILTHGWRRFNWQAIVQGEIPAVKYPAEQDYLTLSGKIYGVNSKQLRSPGKIYAVLQAKDSSRQIASVDIQPDGTFKDSSVVLFDSSKVLYRFSNKAFALLKDVRFFSNVVPVQKHIDLDTSKIFFSDTLGNPRLRYLADEKTRLDALLKSTTLKGVTVTTKVLSPVQKLEKRYTNGMFKTGDAIQFDLTSNPVNNLYRHVFDYLNNKIGVVQVIPSDEGGIKVLWAGVKPSLYLNEEPINPNVLYSLPVADIAYVKAYRTFLGNYGGSGSAIAIYTRKGIDRPLQQGIFYGTVAGYTLAKEFYSPDYANNDSLNKEGDVRSTLYWNPMIITTPEDRKLSFTFYNNDVTKAVRLILEGVSSEGKLVHIEKVID